LDNNSSGAFEIHEVGNQPCKVASRNAKSQENENGGRAFCGILCIVVNESTINLVSCSEHKKHLVDKEKHTDVHGSWQEEVVEERVWHPPGSNPRTNNNQRFSSPTSIMNLGSHIITGQTDQEDQSVE
jgi:hypothetical protein